MSRCRGGKRDWRDYIGNIRRRLTGFIIWIWLCIKMKNEIILPP
jgi:hypothetical protein